MIGCNYFIDAIDWLQLFYRCHRLAATNRCADERLVVIGRRAPPKKTLSKTLGRKGRGDELWRYTSQPIKQPLLKKLQGKAELSQDACLCFLDILYLLAALADVEKDFKFIRIWLLLSLTSAMRNFVFVYC